MKYEFTEETMAGELICIHAKDNYIASRTVGHTYQSRYAGNDLPPLTVFINDDGDGWGGLWSLEDMNENNTYFKFIPITLLSDRELFLYRISGDLPDWVAQYA